MTILGAEFRLPPLLVFDEPALPSAEDLRGEQILVALGALREALLSLPAPQVHVAAPDLAEIVMAVTSLKPGATAEDIAQAVVGQLAPTLEPAADPILGKLVEALDRLDFRMKGMGGSSGTTRVVPDIVDKPLRQLGIVTVSNPSTPADLSTLAKDATLTNGSARIGGTVAVAGTFFQATQPVSIAATVPVSGAFFQATQPVSGTVAVSNPGLTRAQLDASPVQTLETSGLVPKAFDAIALTYTGAGDVQTVTYRQSGTVVATLTLAYTGTVLTTITRS